VIVQDHRHTSTLYEQDRLHSGSNKKILSTPTKEVMMQSIPVRSESSVRVQTVERGFLGSDDRESTQAHLLSLLTAILSFKRQPREIIPRASKLDG